MVVFLTTLVPVPRVYAVTPPSFPSCLNPGTAIISQHSEGTHGIVGSTETYNGADTVYSVGTGQVTQCFCPASGNAIQTDWWDASSLSDDDISVLTREGWTVVPDGSLWGLSEGRYVARNRSYSCLSNGNTPTGGGEVRGDGRSDGRSSCPECTAPRGIGGGDILGTETGDILGLAATGGNWKLWAMFGASAFLFLTGLRHLKRG